MLKIYIIIIILLKYIILINVYVITYLFLCYIEKIKSYFYEIILYKFYFFIYIIICLFFVNISNIRFLFRKLYYIIYIYYYCV